MTAFVDTYVLIARVFPGLIIALAALVDVAYTAPLLGQY
jgi:hypothetical protein